jgi:hypothetical protein
VPHRALCDSQRGVSRWIGFSGGGAAGRGERGSAPFARKSGRVEERVVDGGPLGGVRRGGPHVSSTS